jgi:glycerol-3-phosphate dehydrogenase
MYDVLVIGGGINGVGIARDAAGRGLKVLLVEKDDLANGTSSASSKLVHGGLRYLETYEFRLVREALAERETLMRIAPHLVWPLRFVLPVMPGMRPAWMLRIGLFLYDHLAKRSFLLGTKTVNLRTDPKGAPLKASLKKGFEYSDGWADDSRLTVLNAVDAASHGADIRPRTQCVALNRHANHWTATLKTAENVRCEVDAKLLVNAAGPWVEDILGQFGGGSNRSKIRLVKGSHIVVSKMFEGDHVYIFQSTDGRVIFAIPYETDYTLIGTTDLEYDFAHGKVEITPEETTYLCAAVNEYFTAQITPADVVWTYSGVRPLFDDQNTSASVVTRDYVFDLNEGDGNQAPVLSIFGGKLTTYRELAERAVDKLRPYFPEMSGAWSDQQSLPGGDFPANERPMLAARLGAQYPWLPIDQRDRMAQAYGTCAFELLGAATSLSELGRHFGGGLFEIEVEYLCKHEFAQTAEDILWRRSKLGLRLSAKEQASLAQWLTEHEAHD